MSISMNTNVSAMQAFSRQMSVSANNVANALPDEFKAARAYNVEGENPDSPAVDTVIVQSQASGPLVEDPLSEDGSLKEMSNTDIAQELVQQIASQHGFDANAKTVQTFDETVGSLLDIVG